jgi:hypothetical protein
MSQFRPALGKPVPSFIWRGGWAILFVLLVGISIQFWRAVEASEEQMVVQQVDFEDSALCAKFGFVTGTANYTSCKLDLLDLRRSDERLVAATSVP